MRGSGKQPKQSLVLGRDRTSSSGLIPSAEVLPRGSDVLLGALALAEWLRSWRAPAGAEASLPSDVAAPAPREELIGKEDEKKVVRGESDEKGGIWRAKSEARA